MKYRVTEYCQCVNCGSDLKDLAGELQCTVCGASFDIRDKIPVLLPDAVDEKQQRYLSCYQGLAKDDLQEPLETNRPARHAVLRDFIGDLRGKRILDIGSSNAVYLRDLGAEFKVAFDLALPYLKAIPEADNIAKVCGDAEQLPIKPGFFDVIIVSDILEHLLNPDRLVTHLRRIATPQTRIIIHIPWEEDLAHYRDCKYEFAHLRSFNSYNFDLMFNGYYAKRCRYTHPGLDQPLLFRLDGKIPRILYNVLVYLFFHSTWCQRESRWRERCIKELPRRESWLLYFYKPVYRIYELRSGEKSVYSIVSRIQQALRALWSVWQKARTWYSSAHLRGVTCRVGRRLR